MHTESRNRLMDLENKLTVNWGWGGGTGGETENEFEISMNTLLFLKQITNRTYCIEQAALLNSL